ncbi:helix-turn-helix transcriptional regulator [Macrococcus lamae]|uniref:AraC family transcriptional regulator n=1 Tax=Macrococcus lamae TaxID=198484 RepID=A0A4V3BEU8_9STAP|nr:AraC family transcriptional regulator [Macrococcus lamae]TDM07946.1 AraC family transcriptional regulator [Macrococcus lamae]
MIISSSQGLYLSRKNRLNESFQRNDDVFKIIINCSHHNLYKVENDEIIFGRDKFLTLSPNTNHQQLLINDEKILIEIKPHLVQSIASDLSSFPSMFYLPVEHSNEKYTNIQRLVHLMNQDIDLNLKQTYLDSFITRLIIDNIITTDTFNNKETKYFSEFIASNYTEQWSLEDLAHALGYSKYHLIKKFNQCFNMSPIEYLNHKRIERSIALLRETELTFTEIAYSTGFSSYKQFSSWFKQLTFLSPKQFKEKYSRYNH